MYPVSAAYQKAIREKNREYKILGTITLVNGDIINITGDDLFENRLVITEQCVSKNDIDIGSVYAGEMRLGIKRELVDNAYSLAGARIELSFGLKVAPDEWEYVPLGKYYVTEIEKRPKSIELVALDALILFDIDLSGVLTSGTPYGMITSCCTKAGVTLATSVEEFAAFPNSSLTFSLPENSNVETCRDLIMWVCQLLGAFAVMNRQGQLEIRSFKGNPVREITVPERYSLAPSDFSVTVSEVKMTVNGTEYAQGEPGMLMALEENPFLIPKSEGDINVVLINLLGSLSEVAYIPYECYFIGDPALEVGDFVTFDKVDNVRNDPFLSPFMITEQHSDLTTIITHSTWRYYGKQHLKAAGQTAQLKGSYSQATKSVSSIEKSLKEVQELATQTSRTAQLLNNAIGGNILIRENGETNEILIMDSADPAEAVKIWRWNIAGLGYSDNVTGADNPLREYSVAMTMDGSIDAAFIRTGILISQNNRSWINLNDGSFSFGDGSFYWNGETGGIQTKKGYTFSDDGLIIDSESSQTKTLVDEAGMEVIDKSGSSEKTLFYAGIDSEGRATVETEFINVKTYIKIGNNSRIQDYTTGRTGVFYVGG